MFMLSSLTVELELQAMMATGQRNLSKQFTLNVTMRLDLVSSHVTQPLFGWMMLSHSCCLFAQLVFVQRNHQCSVSATVPLWSITVGQPELMLKMQTPYKTKRAL